MKEPTESELLEKACEWIKENPGFVVGYIESLQNHINEMREAAGADPVTPFLHRFK